MEFTKIPIVEERCGPESAKLPSSSGGTLERTIAGEDKGGAATNAGICVERTGSTQVPAFPRLVPRGGSNNTPALAAELNTTSPSSSPGSPPQGMPASATLPPGRGWWQGTARLMLASTGAEDSERRNSAPSVFNISPEFEKLPKRLAKTSQLARRAPAIVPAVKRTQDPGESKETLRAMCKAEKLPANFSGYKLHAGEVSRSSAKKMAAATTVFLFLRRRVISQDRVLGEGAGLRAKELRRPRW